MNSLGTRVAISLSWMTDPTKHELYSSWHGLDHQPENLALQGVALGRRWVRTPACAAYTTTASEALAPTQYVNFYWFREPIAESIREWEDLASLSRVWGRRPEVDPGVRDPVDFWKPTLGGFWVPVHGYVAPSVAVPPDVLPFRPDRGIHLTVSRLSGTAIDVMNVAAWYDRVRLPDLTATPGASGAWTFISSDTFDQDRSSSMASFLQITVLYLEEPPVDFAARLPGRLEELKSQGRFLDTSGVEEVLYAGPFQTVIPWQWDWFDEEPRPA
jgi:hypothetical protein